MKHSKPSHLAVPVTSRNLEQAKTTQASIREKHPKLVETVTGNARLYEQHYLSRVRERTSIYQRYYGTTEYRFFYGAYFQYGFFGGYYYPVRPRYDIHVHFTYPLVYWLYVDTLDEEYYRAWYGNDYEQYRFEVFPFARVFYPTDTLCDLMTEVSALSALQQHHFRLGLVNVVESLQSQISNYLVARFAFGDSDIVLTHYRNLDNKAIVLSGFVDRGELHVSFKALVDLEDNKQSLVFMPTSQKPVEQELETLTKINDRMRQYGVDPLQGDEEPTRR